MRAIPYITLIAAFAGLTSLTACSKIESQNLTTSGMYAKFTAVDDGSTVATLATLSTSAFSNDTIALSSGDTLTATFSGQTKAMTGQLSSLGEHDYIADFPTTGPTQTVNIALNRSGGTSAPNSNVVLPAGFTITGPTNGTAYTVSNNDTITITWSPASTGSSASIKFSGSCTTASSLQSFILESTITDSGTYSTTVNNLLARIYSPNAVPSNPQCAQITATVKRSQVGTVDSNIGQGGYFTGTEARSITFSITP